MRFLVGALCLASLCAHADPMERLVRTASGQVGVTTHYDPAYTRISFPGGDVPMERGVCTDVVIRAYRSTFNVDLQKRVNEDMRANFALYPKQWGLKRPDSNIDHRRVPNLQVFFSRKGQALPVSQRAEDYRPGDLVTQMLPGNLPHIAIVTAEKGASGAPKVVHNIGAGARIDDTLFRFPITGHYRYLPQETGGR